MKLCTTEIQSPYVRSCCLNQQNICVGCYRSIDEIARWSQSSDFYKLETLENVMHRKAAAMELKSELDSKASKLSPLDLPDALPKISDSEVENPF